MRERAGKLLFKTLVIICEDSKVTPNYLNGFLKEMKGKGIWDTISVYPFPSEEDSTVSNSEPHKSKRKIRKLVPATKEPGFEIEPEYRAVPVRYVREVQLRMLEEGYDEGWAVYDKDGHPGHKAAYLLSKRVPQINIGFSGIAIEHWFLLHFERNSQAFRKSADVPLSRVIPGYTSEGKAQKVNMFFSKIRKRLGLAIYNAAWLRRHVQYDIPAFYERNPYTNIDHLIFRLSGYQLIFPPENLVIGKICLHTEIVDRSLVIRVENNSSSHFLTDEMRFYYFNDKGEKVPSLIEREIIEPGGFCQYSFSMDDVYQIYIEIRSKVIVIDTTVPPSKPVKNC